MTELQASPRPLVETIVAMRVIGRSSTVAVAERIRMAAPELHPPLCELIEVLPSHVGRVATDVLGEMALEPGGRAPAASLALGRVSDPRNYREVCDGLSVLVDSGDERAQTALAGALTPVAAGIRRLSVLLSSVSRRGDGAMSYADGTLTVGDATLSVREASELLERVSRWHRAGAGSAVIATRPADDSSAPPGLGRDDPLWLLEERSLVLLPGRTGVARRIAVEPVPRDLGGPLTLEHHVRLEFLDGVRDEWRPKIREVLAASLRVCSLVLQHQFFSTLDDVSVVVHPQEHSLAYLVPESSTLHVFSGPVGPYVVTHELGHLVDSRLAASGTFRSEESSPLAQFTDAARHLYEPVVRARASRYAQMLADAAMPGLPGVGHARLESVVAALPFVREDGRSDVTQSLLDGRRVTREHPGGLGRRIEQVTSAIAQSILLQVDVPQDERTPGGPGDSGAYVDLAGVRSELASSEVARLLSAPEVFARFFDQYSRLLADQKGMAFGPRVRPSDLDLASVGRLAPLFLAAIFREQADYLERRATSRGASKLSDTVVAGVTALAGAAVAVLFPEGGRR